MTVSLSDHFTYQKLLRFVAPSIFMMIITSIYSIVDGFFVSNFVGKNPFAALNLIFPVIMALAAFGFMIGTGGSALIAKTLGEGKQKEANEIFSMLVVALAVGGAALSGFSTIYQIILDIVPSDIVSPFLNGNTLQIIFLGAAVGIALLILGDRAAAVRTFIEQTNEVVQFLMEAIGDLIPLFVFFSLFALLGSDFGSELSGILKAIVITYALCPLMCLVFIGILAARRRVSFRLLVQKLLPTFLIGLTTASSSAAFATNLETCEKKLGIPPMLAHFAVPLEQVLYMPSVAVAFVATCLCMAENFGTAITPAWLLTMIVVTGLLSLAMPPIPGGALTCYTVMFTQLGIPGEALALAVAINSMIDFIATASNLTCLQVEVTTVAGQLGMLDTECLRNPG